MPLGFIGHRTYIGVFWFTRKYFHLRFKREKSLLRENKLFWTNASRLQTQGMHLLSHMDHMTSMSYMWGQNNCYIREFRVGIRIQLLFLDNKSLFIMVFIYWNDCLPPIFCYGGMLWLWFLDSKAISKNRNGWESKSSSFIWKSSTERWKNQRNSSIWR